jgi:hypothetical protein
MKKFNLTVIEKNQVSERKWSVMIPDIESRKGVQNIVFNEEKDTLYWEIATVKMIEAESKEEAEKIAFQMTSVMKGFRSHKITLEEIVEEKEEVIEEKKLFIAPKSDEFVKTIVATGNGSMLTRAPKALLKSLIDGGYTHLKIEKYGEDTLIYMTETVKKIADSDKKYQPQNGEFIKISSNIPDEYLYEMDANNVDSIVLKDGFGEKKVFSRQEKHLAKLERRNGIYFNPADPADAARLAKFDVLPNKTEAIKKWLDSLDN